MMSQPADRLNHTAVSVCTKPSGRGAKAISDHLLTSIKSASRQTSAVSSQSEMKAGLVGFEVAQVVPAGQSASMMRWAAIDGYLTVC